MPAHNQPPASDTALVEVPARLAEMIAEVCRIRGYRSADYLEPMLKVMVTVDWLRATRDANPQRPTE